MKLKCHSNKKKNAFLDSFLLVVVLLFFFFFLRPRPADLF